MGILDQGIAIGPLGLRVGLVLLIGAAAASLAIGWWLGRRSGTATADRVFNLLLIAAAGARLVFVLRYHAEYAGLADALDIRDGGFDPLGGLVFGAGYLTWVAVRHHRERRPLGGALAAGTLSWCLLFGGAHLLLERPAGPIPDVVLHSLDGEPVSPRQLAEGSGRPMVINVWASWCPPCRREMPVLARAQRERSDVIFLFVNHGEEADRIRDFLVGEDLSPDNVLMDPAGTLDSGTDFLVLPTTYYYDASGRLVDSHVGELSRATLRRSLERLD